MDGVFKSVAMPSFYGKSRNRSEALGSALATTFWTKKQRLLKQFSHKNS